MLLIHFIESDRIKTILNQLPATTLGDSEETRVGVRIQEGRRAESCSSLRCHARLWIRREALE